MGDNFSDQDLQRGLLGDESCSYCQDRGLVFNARDGVVGYETCLHCNNHYHCQDCNGTGYVLEGRGQVEFLHVKNFWMNAGCAQPANRHYERAVKPWMRNAGGVMVMVRLTGSDLTKIPFKRSRYIAGSEHRTREGSCDS